MKQVELNHIGLNVEKANELAKQLNELLATYQTYYQNLRGFHWNVKGQQFFELHLKFEELYNDALIKIDEIAERILTLGASPLHTYSDYIKVSAVQEAIDISEGTKAVVITRDNLSTLVQIERDILKLAGETEDEGTITLISDYISQQEKIIWMLSAYLHQ